MPQWSAFADRPGLLLVPVPPSPGLRKQPAFQVGAEDPGRDGEQELYDFRGPTGESECGEDDEYNGDEAG